MSIPTVDRLALDDLPRGRLHRLWLRMTHDALAEPVSVPVLVVRGAKKGPWAAVTAAVHGNEVNGVPVIHALFERLDPTKVRGTLIGVPVANVPAFLLRQRRTDDGHDLNHLFPGKAKGKEAEVYAHRFFKHIVSDLDLLIDLHTASFGRVNCLYVRADMTDPTTARMARLQRPQIILHSRPADGTLRGAAAARGVAAVTVEIGNPHRVQRDHVRRTRAGVRAVLADFGMIPRRAPSVPVDDPVVCHRSKWLFTDRGGFLEVQPRVTDRVEKGDAVATLVDAFGEPIRTYEAPRSGIVIGHSVDPVADTGARILHLGEIAPPDHEILQGETTT